MALLPRRFLDVQLDTVGMCNLRCRMCYLTYDKRPPEIMPLELFEHIAREVFPRTRTLVLSWATEPLLHPRFREILDITGRYRIPEVSLVTNGTRLDGATAELLIRAGVDLVVVSMDGGTPETYERVRRGAKWDRVMANLAAFDAKRKERRSKTPRLVFNYLLMRSTVEELPVFIDAVGLFRPREINAFFMELQPGAPMADELIDACDPAFRSMLPAAKSAARRHRTALCHPYPGRGRIPWSLSKLSIKLRRKPLCAAWLWLRTVAAMRRLEPRSYCLEPATRLVIWPDGSVQPCCAWGPEPLDTLAGRTFDEVWQSKTLREIRAGLRGGANLPEVCVDCTVATSKKLF